jgi:hypothetical protein
MDGPARRLATHMLSEFFSQPIRDDKPALRLVVDNRPADAAHGDGATRIYPRSFDRRLTPRAL